jgi:uncharacterized membrane protein
MQSDLYSNFNLLFRWLHVIAGITWIGLLYFFNFVNGPLQGKLDAPTKKVVNPQLMPRALWWFRWAAMLTFIMGLTLFTMIYMYTPDKGFGPSVLFKDPSMSGEILTGRGWWILLGMTCGFVMWFNVWFIITPAQKIIQTGTRDGEKVDPKLGPRAALASKINTYLSGPMLFGMLAPNHYGSIDWPIALICIGLALAAIHHVYKVAPKVQASFATDGKGAAPAAAPPAAAAPADKK